MFKIAALLWIVVGTVLAGVALTVIVSVPELYAQGARLIPILCGAGFLIAMPVAYVIARQIAGQATT
jgi:preprotein translocase subunit SecY